ncbi:MAG: 4-hydroxy-tetrahydrodipicolinate reductase [Clostridium sp.]
MIKAIMHGCNGAMGQVITGLVSEDTEISIVAGVDVMDNKSNPYPVFPSIEECNVEADVIIDFSSAKAVDALLSYCNNTGMPVVVCTTGLSAEQVAQVTDTAKKTAVLRSANMSLGINVLLKLVQEAASVLAAADFDIEILEKHHNQKIDAPSGTALALADSINDAMNQEYHYIYDRASQHVKRDKKEIGIQAIRGGSIVGEHDVIFAGKDEVITFSHTAYSKTIFAKGAVQAAKFLADKQPGLYSMADVINQ